MDKSESKLEQQEITFNGTPIEQMRMEMLCSILKRDTHFDGDEILRAWNELVQFYVRHRDSTGIAAPTSADSQEREALKIAEDVLLMIVATTTDQNAATLANDNLPAIRAALAAPKPALTADEIADLWQQFGSTDDWIINRVVLPFARAVLAAAQEK